MQDNEHEESSEQHDGAGSGRHRCHGAPASLSYSAIRRSRDQVTEKVAFLRYRDYGEQGVGSLAVYFPFPQHTVLVGTDDRLPLFACYDLPDIGVASISVSFHGVAACLSKNGNRVQK